MSLIESEYPSITEEEKSKYREFLEKRCSEYYFLGYLRCTSGNVADAATLYILDDRLRAILLRYLVRLEIQMKTDFVSAVESATGSSSFWDNPIYYLPSARIPSAGHSKSKFEIVRDSIRASLSKHPFTSPGPSNMRAANFISLGTFVSLFQYIDTPYKSSFITKYTSYLPQQNYGILFRYLQAIRIVRNRCAHGNHVITKKMNYELSSEITLVRPPLTPFSSYGTVFESVILFLLKTSNCSSELRSSLRKCLRKYQPILSVYPFALSLSRDVFNNLGL